MGQLQNNFKKSLSSAIEGPDKMMYKSLLKKTSLGETKKVCDCKKTHPGKTHKEWEKTKEEEMGESTTSASAGGFMAPLGVDPRFRKKKKGEMEEETTSYSSGAYATPQIWAKNEKNWRGKAKTQWPGGKFVKVKDKCKKFPYCNQGDINALDLTENIKIKKAINEVSKKTGVNRKHIRELVKNELEEIIGRRIYKSPITSILGPESKINKPIGKIYSMGSNVGGKYE